MSGFTPGPWSIHTMDSDGEPRPVPDGWLFNRRSIGAGDVLIGGADWNNSPTPGFPQCASNEEMIANANLMAAAPELLDVVMAVIDATRDYLPPDGIGRHEFINRVIAATDNPDVCRILRSVGAL